MKVGFVGIGSIAKRHILNLHAVYEKRGGTLQIDAFRSGNGKSLPADIENRIHCVYDFNDTVFNDYDVIFITNPTSMHLKALRHFDGHTKAFFIEKPVFDSGSTGFGGFIPKENIIYYVACPLRYMSVIQYVKNRIDLKRVYALRAMSSSYLPEWRPDTDYRQTYSSHKEMGGGYQLT